MAAAKPAFGFNQGSDVPSPVKAGKAKDIGVTAEQGSSMYPSPDDHVHALTGTAPTTGQWLKYNGTLWVPADIALADLPDIALSDLSDVDVQGAVDTKILMKSSGTWQENTLTIDNCSDVTLTSPATNEILRYNGTDWVNAGASFGTWSPSIVQGVTILTVVDAARYIRFGRFVFCWYDVSVSNNGINSGTSGSVVQLALPTAHRSVTTNGIVEIGGAYTVSTSGQLMVSAVVNSGDESNLRFVRRDQAASNFFGADPNISLGNTNRISGFAVYEAAS